MSDPADLALGWLSKGLSDLAAARAVLGGEGPFDTACFHCQQAAEKFMKALLVNRGISFPYTHDLDELARLCQQAVPTIRLLTPEVVALTEYAVSLRYDNEFWPSRDDATKALAIAEQVYESIRTSMR